MDLSLVLVLLFSTPVFFFLSFFPPCLFEGEAREAVTTTCGLSYTRNEIESTEFALSSFTVNQNLACCHCFDHKGQKRSFFFFWLKLRKSCVVMCLTTKGKEKERNSGLLFLSVSAAVLR